jgi:ribulose-phosphate 3-epimerase
MIEIIPAIMPDHYDDLVEKASRVRSLVPLAQIDIMDGAFVRSRSWPYTEGGTRKEPHFVGLMNQDEGMPHWEDLDYELDLMIGEPEKHIDEWLPLGASRIIFHLESIKNFELFFAHDMWKEGARDIGGEKVVELGLAINPDTSIEELLPHIDRLDLVQCMGIAKVGYQGQPFDERVLERVNTLRVRYPNLPISVDGGVTTETAPDLKHAGATRLVSGSAIFKSGDIPLAIHDLEHSVL